MHAAYGVLRRTYGAYGVLRGRARFLPPTASYGVLRAAHAAWRRVACVLPRPRAAYGVRPSYARVRVRVRVRVLGGVLRRPTAADSCTPHAAWRTVCYAAAAVADYYLPEGHDDHRLRRSTRGR